MLVGEGVGGVRLVHRRLSHAKEHRPDLKQREEDERAVQWTDRPTNLAAVIDEAGRLGDVAGRHRRCHRLDPGRRAPAPARLDRSGLRSGLSGMISAKTLAERFVLRTPPPPAAGCAGKLFQAAGIALPPNIREAASAR